MEDILVAVAVLAILGLAIGYIVKAKKSGMKCIGCSVAGKKSPETPQASSCAGGCAGCSGCSCHLDIE